MTTLGYLRGVREWAYPMRTTTAFLEKGVLTPDEFVRAGDELVFRCPTWSWESGDASKQRSYLPPDKQYLITRNVPCQTRVGQLEQQLTQVLQQQRSANGDDDGDDDEWLISTILKPDDVGGEMQNIEDDFDIVDETGEIVERQEEKLEPAESHAAGSAPNNEAGAEDDYADMADYEDSNVLSDEDATDPTALRGSSAAGGRSTSAASRDNLLKVRTYDLSITYDKYYQTPRVWMVGTSASGQPLSAKEMMEDVMTDYANKTVTIENHPHVAGPHASIHPCQHGKVMKRIVQNLVRASNSNSSSKNDGVEQTSHNVDEPTVEMYLFIFLKFVNSIIPTINYDFTMDVTASTQK
ncbi:hypothetical protein ACA910_016039 [Epithemia clementina (nom. ined.)]